MNRFRKEEAIKHRTARDGLSDAEVNRLDREDAINAEINELARTIHIKKFSEEYSHMYDSITDANERSRNINPMSTDYIAKIDAKRAAEGVTALSSAGMSVSDDTWKLAYTEAEAVVRGRN